VTIGHVDLIERAVKLFDGVIVVVLNNPSKRGCFSVEERLDMLAKVCLHLPTVEVDSFDGFLTEYIQKRETRIVIRGIRTIADIDYEFQMAQINRQMVPEMETLFLMVTAQYAHVSSSAVREICGFGGDISAFVPAIIVEQIHERLWPHGRMQ